MKTLTKSLFVLLLGFISMTSIAETLSRDEAQIRSNINSFSAMADQGAYQHLGRLFAPELTVDYTALFGGEATKVTNSDLMKQWAGFLPGFDTTYHELSNLTVNIDNDKAQAKVNFTASHWLGEGFWQVSGGYIFELERAHDNWVITSVTVTNPSEQGSRDILGQAPTLAQKNLVEREAHLVDYN